MTDDERAIRELVATWMTASEAGNLDTVLGLMTDHVGFVVPGREPFGKETFAAAARSMTGVRMQGSNDIRELVVLGDVAYLRNHIALTITPPGGARCGARATRSRSCAKGRMAAGPSLLVSPRVGSQLSASKRRQQR